MPKPDPLYARCNLCDGTLKTVRPATVDGYRHYPGAPPFSGTLPENSVCPCKTSKTPGFAEVGLTLGQVERIMDRAARATESFRELDGRLTACGSVEDAYPVVIQWLEDYLWVGPLVPQRLRPAPVVHVNKPADPPAAQEGHDPHPEPTPTDGHHRRVAAAYSGALADVPVLVVHGPKVGAAQSQPVPQGLAEGGAAEEADGGPAGYLRPDLGGEAG